MYESLTYRDSSWTYSYIHPISYAYTSHSRRARAACIAVSSCVKKPANARLRNWIRGPLGTYQPSNWASTAQICASREVSLFLVRQAAAEGCGDAEYGA